MSRLKEGFSTRQDLIAGASEAHNTADNHCPRVNGSEDPIEDQQDRMLLWEKRLQNGQVADRPDQDDLDQSMGLSVTRMVTLLEKTEIVGDRHDTRWFVRRWDNRSLTTVTVSR